MRTWRQLREDGFPTADDLLNLAASLIGLSLLLLVLSS